MTQSDKGQGVKKSLVDEAREAQERVKAKMDAEIKAQQKLLGKKSKEKK